VSGAERAARQLTPSADRQVAMGTGAPITDHQVAPHAGAPSVRTAQASDARSLRHFPLWEVVALNGLTVVQYLAGCAAIVLAYRRAPIVGLPVGLAYLVFAAVQCYVFKPLVVCPGCVYRSLGDGRCPTGLNLVSAAFCRPSASAREFRERCNGALCPSRLSLASWLAPLPLALPGLVVWFSWTAAALAALVATLAVARLLVVRAAVCPRCLARRWCPASRPRPS
jgi:hypothetical protein